jgi:phosphoglycerate dehydrogenase-like enzyme
MSNVVKKIAIHDFKGTPFFEKKHIKNIKNALPEVEIVYSFEVKDLMENALDADVLIAFPFFPPELVDYCKKAKNLKLIHSVIAGIDGFVKSEIRDLPIRITSTKGIHGYPIADHTLAYIFAFLRNFPVFFQAKLNKKYLNEAGYGCDETFEKTVGIIGTGNIGLYIAKKCKLLGFKVLGLKRTPIESEWLDTCYSNDQIDKLLEESDFVVIAIPSTPDTKKLIGEKELDMMKRSAYLINIARGDVVDEEALIKALEEKAIAGAGLDVYAEEPLPAESKLWDLPNVIMTPHIAARSPYYNDRCNKVTIENLLRFARGEELLFEADKNRGY